MEDLIDKGHQLVASARDSVKSAAGVQFNGSGRAHITPREKLRLTTYLKNYHFELAKSGVGYQFLEIFLSGMMFDDAEQAHNVVEDNAMFASSVLHYNRSGNLGRPDPKTIAKFWRNHPSNITVSDIEQRITEIRREYSIYTAGDIEIGNSSRQYEYFRYFCAITLISYLINSPKFQFWDLGIEAFFDTIINDKKKGVNFKVFRFIKRVKSQGKKHENNFTKELGALIEGLDGKIPEPGDLDEMLRSLSGRDRLDCQKKSVEFLNLLSKNIDALCLIIINNRREMPLPCYSAFFGFSTNAYPAWVGSFTKTGILPTVPRWSIPSKVIEHENRKYNKTIHYPSYQNYLDAFDTILVDEKNSELGVMLILPFHAKIGNFRKTGFVRAMRRFCIDSKELILDEFEDKFFKSDTTIISLFRDDIRNELENNLGSDEFLKTNYNKKFRKKMS